MFKKIFTFVNICYPQQFYVLLGVALKIPLSPIFLWYFYSKLFAVFCNMNTPVASGDFIYAKQLFNFD